MNTRSPYSPILRTTGLARLFTRLNDHTARLFRISNDLIAFLARLSLSTTFWASGQAKIEGFALDPFNAYAELGFPRLSEGAVDLFEYDYPLPLVSPELAATLVAVSEHAFSLLLLVGLAARLSALVLLGITAMIQLPIYPSASAALGLWAVASLYIMAHGPGILSVDRWLSRIAHRATRQ